MTSRLAQLLVAPIVLAACSPHTQVAGSPQKRHGLRRELLGCYALVGLHGQSVTAMPFHPPGVARLDSVPADEDTWRLFPDGSPPPGVPHMTAWSADSMTDTVRLTFSDGLTGTDFILAARGDTWPGRAVSFGDAGPTEWESGQVAAHRIDCRAFEGRRG